MTSTQQAQTVLCTPIETYTHPEFENTVDLVGMVHLAEGRYYDQIQSHIDGRDEDGAVIHYEMMKAPTPESALEMSKAQLKKIARLRIVLNSVYEWFGDCGLTMQKDGLDYQPHWENHDATAIEAIERISTVRLFTQATVISALGKIFESIPPEEKRKQLVEKLIEIQAEDAGEIEPDTSRSRQIARLLIGHDMDFILDYRNDIALRAFDAQQVAEPGSDVSLIWGYAHLKGLGQGLKDRGYTKVDEVSVLAIRP